jgi:ABC-type branched-subunit amino acid transport system ATPase component
MTLLSVQSVSVRYGSVLALEDASLEVAEGQAVALLGANGAGKSTLLRAVTGLLPFHGGRVESGEIRLEGRSLSGWDAARRVRAGLAQVMEGRRVFPGLTVEENLKAGAFSARESSRFGTTAGQVYELFPLLRARARQRAGLLSGGEQQMLAIGRALMAQPRLLLLDEPSLGLAPMVVTQIGRALRDISQRGVAILLVEQSTALALEVTSDAYLLETGRVTHQGPTASLLADDQVRAAYLGATLH